MPERINAIKPNEFLIKEVKPIIVCHGTPEDFKEKKEKGSESSFTDASEIFGLGDMKNVEWKKQEPVFSNLDSSNKYSEGYNACMGLVVAGVDKETGKNISFLVHQDPVSVLEDEALVPLRGLLLDIKSRCKEGTIDAVIVGGSVFLEREYNSNKGYPEPIKLFGGTVKKFLGFAPMVVNGPKGVYPPDSYQTRLSSDPSEKHKMQVSDDIYYDNDNRRLYLVRPKVNPDIGSFPFGEVDKQKDKWK